MKYEENSKKVRFESVYKQGKRNLTLLHHKNNYLLSIHVLLQAVKPEGETYSGVHDIAVDQIIGTENRSSDFSAGFFPVHKWMQQRWSRVRDLMLTDKITDRIKVLEYGGYYFVRDGNHRVSVAKTHNIAYLTAEVITLHIPIQLQYPMTVDRLPLLQAKYKFYKQYPVFDVIPEHFFQVEQVKTWDILKDSIFRGHKKWFIRKNGYEPEFAELVQSWNIELYTVTMYFINKHSLPTLFPGHMDTDIFCALMEFWNPREEQTMQEVYEQFIEETKKRNRVSYLHFAIKDKIQWIVTTDEQSKFDFLHRTRLYTFYPDAEIPKGNKYWYHFLSQQIVDSHYKYVKHRIGREPYMEEVVSSWYEELFEPAFELYKENAIVEDFSSFYIKWMRIWHKKIIKHQICGLKESFYIHIR